MKMLLPQEVDVWYMLPWIRKELAFSLKKNFDLSQKQIASILGVTAAAVSQYVHQKRGEEPQPTGRAKELIDEAAEKLSKKEDLRETLSWLQSQPEIIEVKCALHRKHDDTIDETCDLCMKK